MSQETKGHKALEAVIADAARLYNAGVPLMVDDAIKQANFGEYGVWTLAKSRADRALGAAAALAGTHQISGKRVGVILSGGSVDMSQLAGWMTSLA